MAYHHALKHNDQTVDLSHVKGHQDEEAKYDKLDYQTKCNIDCNEMAGDTIKTTSQPVPFTPHPGSKAMLQIDGKWIT